MVSEKKVLEMKKIAELLKKYKTVLLFDLRGLPSKQTHSIRNQLKKNEIFSLISNKSVLELALKEIKIDLDFKEINQPGIIYSNKGIFEIVKELKKLKAKRKAKVNETATSDIELKAMDTNIQAGPAISIFKQFKIQTIMKNGKIAIKDPKVICETGGKITSDLVSLLNMLGIEPMELMIRPEVGFSEDLVYSTLVLNLDENYFQNQLSEVANNLFKITVNLGYPTKQNTAFLIQKSYNQVRNVGINTRIPAKEVLPDILRIAQSKAQKLTSVK